MKNEAIKMRKKSLSAARIAAFCLPLVLVASCGPEAVQGTSVLFDPPAVAQTTTPTTSASLTRHLFTIELKSPTGYAQINTELLIDLPSGGTLYTVDTSTTPPTYTAVAFPYLTTTNSNGVRTVAIDFTSPLGANGDITVISAFSGTGYGRVNVTYTCSATAPAVCPT